LRLWEGTPVALDYNGNILDMGLWCLWPTRMQITGDNGALLITTSLKVVLHQLRLANAHQKLLIGT